MNPSNIQDKDKKEKVTRKLIKREYLGEGFVHVFTNNKTGAIRYVPCTKEEYERMGEPGGSKYNPVLKGHTWKNSLGGTDKVDTPDTVLGVDEYCIKEGKVIARLSDAFKEDTAYLSLPIESVDQDDNLDEEKVIELGYGNSV